MLRARVLIFFLALLALGLFSVPTARAGGAASYPGYIINMDGQRYVALADWASANGFRGHTEDRGRAIFLVNNSTYHPSRLEFQVDSAEAKINGVGVRLSFPIAVQKNGNVYAPCISELDIRSVLKPLLGSSASSTGSAPNYSLASASLPHRVTTICIDPGHGGKDSGNRVMSGFSTHSEKTYTLDLAKEVRRQLEAQGFTVILTRTRDVYVPLSSRPALANAKGADLFVSLHFNASQADPGSVSGPETYCITPAGAKSSNDHGEFSEGSVADTGVTVANKNGNEQRSLLLAYQMEKSLTQNLHAEDRGVRRARFAVLREATMPAILIEGGYMTNPSEGKKIFDAGYRQQMASAIVKGILAYVQPTSASPRADQIAAHQPGKSPVSYYSKKKLPPPIMEAETN